MKGELYNPGQPHKKEDFDYQKYSLQDSLSDRFVDLYSPGVIFGSQELGETIPFAITSAGGLFINIGSGVAMASGTVNSSDSTTTGGERIHVPASETGVGQNYRRAPGGGPGSGTGTGPYKESTNGLGGYTPTPQSTLTRLIPVTDATTNYVWIGYLHAIDPSVYSLHKATSGKIYPRGLDGYDILVTTSPTTPIFNGNANYHLLGTVVTAAGLVTVIDQTSVIYARTKSKRVGVTLNTATPTASYSNGQTKFIDEHVNCFGTGTLGPNNPHKYAPADIGLTDFNFEGHRLTQHSNGVIMDNVLATDRGLYPSTTTSTPVGGDAGSVVLKQLAVGEYAFVGGKSFTEVFPKIGAPMPPYLATDAYVSFPSGGAGTYEIILYIDGTQLKAKREPAAYTPTSMEYQVCTVVWDGSAFTGITDDRAFGSIGSKDILKSSVGTLALIDLAVTEAKHADLSCTTIKIGNLAVTEAKLGPAAVTNTKIGVDAIYTAQIADATVTDPDDSTTGQGIATPQLRDGAVTTNKYRNASITAAKLAPGAVVPPIRCAVQGPAVVTGSIAAVKALAEVAAGSIGEVQFYVDTIPTGTTALEIDVRINGTSIFTTRPAILPNSTPNAGGGIYISTNTTVGSSPVISPTFGQLIGQINSLANSYSKGARISLHILSVGDTTPGGDDLIVNILL
jgi:hypothetical protein